MSSFIFWGPPGTGKTTLAASFIDAGFNVHVIDVDCKVKGMKNLERHLKSKKLSYWEISEPVTGATLEQVARGELKWFPMKLPKGYMQICKIIDSMKDDPPKGASKTVLVIDSSTRVNEHLKALMMHYQKGKLEFSGWGAMLANWEALCDTFFKLQPEPFAHCVLTCHARDENDEELGRIWSKPLIDTQMREKVGTYVEEMYYCTAMAVTKTSEPKYQVITKPTGRILHARSSFDLPTTVDADMKKILKGGT